MNQSPTPSPLDFSMTVGGWRNSGVGEALGVVNRHVLHATITVMDEIDRLGGLGDVRSRPAPRHRARRPYHRENKFPTPIAAHCGSLNNPMDFGTISHHIRRDWHRHPHQPVKTASIRSGCRTVPCGRRSEPSGARATGLVAVCWISHGLVCERSSLNTGCVAAPGFSEAVGDMIP